MSDSDPDSSFEVVEEEITSSVADSSIETIGRDRLDGIESDGIWNVCECSHAKQQPSDQYSTYSIPDTSKHLELSWIKTPSSTGFPTESDCPNSTLALPGTEHAKPVHRRTRRRHSKRLSSNDSNESQAHPPPVTTVPRCSHAKLLFGGIALFGLTIALLYTTIRQSQLISHLESELARSQLHYEKDLRQELEKHTEQDAKSRALILDLQKERYQLLNDLQTQLERQANRDTEARETILELQTERRKLMDSMSSTKHRHSSDSDGLSCKKLKSRNAVLEKQLQETRDELHDVKQALFQLKEGSLCLPGMKFFNWLLCKGFRLCNEVFP